MVVCREAMDPNVTDETNLACCVFSSDEIYYCDRFCKARSGSYFPLPPQNDGFIGPLRGQPVLLSSVSPTPNERVGDVAMFDHNDRHWNTTAPITATLLVTMLKVGVVRERRPA